MKLTKKLASLALSILMICSMAISASAVGTGSIVISDVIPDTQYHAYRILDLSWSAGPDGIAGNSDDTHRYTASAKWAAFVNSPEVKDVYLSIDANGIVTWKTGVAKEQAKNLAALAENYLKANSIAADATAHSGSNPSVTISGLDLGYYLVDSEGGALCSLDSTNPVAEINEKNDPTDVEKKVKEGTEWVDSNHSEIGQLVEYKITFTKEAGGQGYKLHDQMDAHLELQDSTIVVYLNDDGSKLDSNKVAPSNYVLDLAPADGHTFDLAFLDSYTSTLADGSKLDVYYSAKVTSNASVGITHGHENSVRLDYGDSNTTEEDKVYTYTYGLDLYKYDPDRGLALEGVEFELYRTKTVNGLGETVYSDPVIVHENGTDPNGKNVYYVCNTAGHIDTTQTLKTPASGELIVRGLDEDTYYLLETKALDGYNPLPDAVEISISASNVQTSGDYEGYYDINVQNQTGAILPETGGMGTTLFYAAGAILSLGAIVLLITKRRMRTEG